MNVWGTGLARWLAVYQAETPFGIEAGSEGELVGEGANRCWLSVPGAGRGEPRVRLVAVDSMARRLVGLPGPQLVRVAHVSGDQLTLQALPGLARRSWVQPMRIEVAELVAEDLSRRYRVVRRGVSDWLYEQLVDGDGDTPRALLVEWSTGAEGSPGDFALIGNGLRADVRRHEDQLLLHRLATARVDGSHGHIVLGAGPLVFADSGEEKQQSLRAEHRAALKDLELRGEGLIASYAAWLDVEACISAEQALAIGTLSVAVSTDEFGLTLRLEPAGLAQLSESGADNQMQIVLDEPRRLDAAMDAVRRALSVAPGTQRADAVLDGLAALGDRAIGGYQLTPEGDLVRTGERRRASSPGRRLAAAAVDRGQLTQLQRRRDGLRKARSATGDVPMLQLALGLGSPPRARRPVHFSHTQLVDAFGGEPTAAQLDALTVALQTPDVAVIQGPPGTGKTRLIGALRSLVEESEVGGQGPTVLLTGTQHETVDHLTATGARPGRMPAARLRSEPELAVPIRAWAYGLAGALPGGGERAGAATARRRLQTIIGILLSRGDKGVPALRGEVLSLVDGRVPHDIYSRLSDAFKMVSAGDAEGGGLSVNRVRRLRCDPVSFGDDGPFQCQQLLADQEAVACCTEEELDTLRQATGFSRGESATALLPQLARLRTRLLQVAAGGRHHSGLNGSLLDVLKGAEQALQMSYEQSPVSVDDALAEFAYTLRHDEQAVHQAVMYFSDAYAVTCQYAGSDGLTLALADPGSLTAAQEITVATPVSTVVVDEAARTNPLDLLIPAQRAKRRVVLVGDQRQLPHLLEQESLARMSEADRRALARPLFEVLFDELRQREAQDRVRRTAVLTEQFRMHPRLGEFVSRNFYEPHGVTLSTPRPDLAAPHEIPEYRGRVAAWLDVPAAAGPERGRPSRNRMVEARRCVQVVRALGAAQPELSVAVIAFYRDQVRCIDELLTEAGLLKSDDPNSPWVGTTDAAQGKEFDVVVLSTVRSGVLAGALEPRGQLGAFGHLTNENRLCVAFSRARKLVVLVGDRGYLTGAAGRIAVPTLGAFADFADSEQSRVG